MKAPVILIVISLMSLALYGQVTIGFSGGENFSSAKFKDHRDVVEKGYNGFYAGLNGKYRITDYIYFALEGQFSEKGHQPGGTFYYGPDQPSSNDFKKHTFKNQYLDVIPEVEVRIRNWVSLGVGAQYGFFLESKRKPEGESWVKDAVSSEQNDFGLTSSVKFYYGKIFTNFRYNYGLHDELV